MLQRIYIHLILILLLLGLSGCSPSAQSPIIFQEDFKQGSLDKSRWEITMDGDFAESVVDVFDIDPGQGTDYRLRIGGNTIGTSNPLKFLGVRSKNTIDITGGTSISFDLDWNNQANGCYLTASLYLCPTESINPKSEDDWLKFEYVGVPPGRNVRINIWEKVGGAVHPLYTDWGPRDDQDRPIGKPLGFNKHRIGMFLNEGSLRVVQDEEEIYPLSKHDLSFTTGYVYLQMSSGTNYPSREVYFDNITVQSASLNMKLP